MAFAPPKSIEGPKMQTKMSSWTPLNHQLLNDRVFEERRALLGKWFDKWTDSQRRRILTSLLERCSLSQQKFCCRKLQEKIPAEALDFTTKLPRVLSVYIFSFLDPRSLCRCAQVSWHWKNLAELDQLWMLKCLRFNWCISVSPSPFEQGIWKEHYIQMVKKLHVTKPKTPPKDGFVIASVQPLASSSPRDKQSPLWSSSTRKKSNPGEKELPPWRSSDKHPTDIIRFNYLDNCDPFQPSSQGRRKRNELTPDFSRQSHDKKSKQQDRARLRKAQSLKLGELMGMKLL
ncbi:F-box only protein 16 isoform X2 [Fukomys damarensis]|uniref:F-box only protein 16 isoform X2 n=1 Tax=Fukomys damarensis TaxID=885580 RepID=UPI00053FB282|nr:F-box only protein 16 isoform X2 [Fukomys damarensis]